jgi:polysaccharide biosynthesis protein PslH
MRVLFLCSKSPYPALEGGPIAMNSLIEGLLEAGHQVKILAVNSDKYNINPDDIPEEYRKKTGIELIHLDLSIKAYDAFLNLLTNKSYHVERFISTEFTKKLIQVLDSTQFDVVQLETLFMVPYISHIRQHSRATIILRAHNIEHLIWQRLAEQTSFWPKRLYLKHLTNTLKSFELKALSQVDGIAAITRKDADFFRGNSSMPVIDIPFGINPLSFDISPVETETPSLFHIGAMNWIPNEEGIRWFLDFVWPEVHKKLPELKFYLAGRYMPGWLVTGYKPNIVVVGEVENAQDFVKSKSIALVPLLSGSGIRIKIIEAMALGKTVITTEIGAEGIFYKHEKNILIANKISEFVESIEKCVKDPHFCQFIGQNARQLIEEVYDNHKIVHRLLLFYNELKKRTSGHH